MAHKYYPVFLEIAGRRCVVIGGGKVAERKALSLLRAGGRVKVVSPVITRRLENEKHAGRITHVARRYRKGDLKGAVLVIAATDSEVENVKVSDEAKSAGILANVVDRPELCTFIVPSTVKRGPLQIAISTSGASPAMAKAIRKELEKLYGPEFGRYLSRLGAMRAKGKKPLPSDIEKWLRQNNTRVAASVADGKGVNRPQFDYPGA